MKNNNKLRTVLDIVIPVFGRPELVQRCVQCLPEAARDVPYQIIITDNGSQRSEIQEYKKYLPDTAKVIENKQNLGFPVACNKAVKQGFSPLILFLNDDAFLAPGSIQAAVMELDNQNVGIVGFKLMFPFDSQDKGRPAGRIQHVGISSNIRGEFFHSFIGWTPDNPKVLAVRDVYAVTGAALMTKRRLFIDAGMFDPMYGLGTFEDVDFCLTVREMGYNVVICQNAVGTHIAGGTSVAKKIQFPLNDNQMKFMQKWGSRIQYTEWEMW